VIQQPECLQFELELYHIEQTESLDVVFPEMVLLTLLYRCQDSYPVHFSQL
jgi:hypothetical protein